jgi:hypothetical protein
MKDSILIAILEVICGFLVIFAIMFNSVKTLKLGKQYDDINLTAANYTLYYEVLESDKKEF